MIPNLQFGKYCSTSNQCSMFKTVSRSADKCKLHAKNHGPNRTRTHHLFSLSTTSSRDTIPDRAVMLRCVTCLLKTGIVEPGIRLQADEVQPVENQFQILSVRCAWCAYQFLGQLTQRERITARAEFFAQHSQCRYRQQLRQVTPRHVQNHNVLSGYHQDSSRSAAVCHVSPRSRHEQIDERIEESGGASREFGSLTRQRLECTWCGDVHFNRYRSKDQHIQRAFSAKHYRCRYRLQRQRNTPQHLPDYNVLSGYHTGSGSDAAVCHVSPVSRHEQQSMKSDAPQKKPRLGTDERDQLTPSTMSVDPKRPFDDKDFSAVFQPVTTDDRRLEFTFRQLRTSTNAASVQNQHEINNLAAHTPTFNQVSAGTSQYC